MYFLIFVGHVLICLVSPRELYPDWFVWDRHELGHYSHRPAAGVLQSEGLNQFEHQHEELQPGEPLAYTRPAGKNQLKLKLIFSSE